MSRWTLLCLVLGVSLGRVLCGQESSQADSIAQPKTTKENSLGMQFLVLPAGKFKRGFDGSNGRERKFQLVHQYSSQANFGIETPAHWVELSHSFAIQTTEVTVVQFRAFVKATGYKTDAEKGKGGLGYFPDERDYVDRFQLSPKVTWQSPGFEQSEKHPVVAVSWNDAMAFCKWLSKKEGEKYRLPTEAEWEYACRGGRTSWYSWGSDPDEAYEYANVADGALEAAHPNTTRYQRAVKLESDEGDGTVFTSPAASYKPNAWGLYDMHGNVWEWCQDRWSADLYRGYMKDVPWPKRSEVTVRDPLILEETDQNKYGDWRSIRGGAWTCAPASVRCSIRTYAEAADATIYTGFRVVREIAP